LLPPEDRALYEQQLNLKKGHTPEEKALFYGNISQNEHDPRSTLEQDEEPSLRIAEDDAVRWYRHFSGYDTHELEMEDGSIVIYEHTFPSTRQVRELEKMRAQIGDGKNDDGKPFDNRELDAFKELWYDKMAEFYLMNTNTGKPMTPEERMSCKNDWHARTVIMSCLWRSNNNIGPRGKNLGASQKPR
jgi:hypothetical protein